MGPPQARRHVLRPAEELPAGDLLLRRYRPADAPALHEAILDSVEHLRPWMPWALQEPLNLADREHLITSVFGPGWDDGTEFVYGIFLGAVVVGGCGLHRRIAADGLEIGYWVRAGHTGRGIATAAAGALVEAASHLDGVTHVEIHHDEGNLASGRVPAKLGFDLVRKVADQPSTPGEVGTSCEWRRSVGAHSRRRGAPDGRGAGHV